MGLWDWIIGAIAGRQAENPAEPPFGVASDPSTEGAVGVATREPPEVVVEEPGAPVENRWWETGPVSQPGPLVVERPELSPKALVLEKLLASHLDGHDLSLPPLPHVPHLVLKHLRKAEWNAAELAEVIAQDQVIAASVLRVCNSPMYRGLDRITALRPAITRLGAIVLRTLMMHQSVRGAVFHGSGRDNELANSLWRRSLVSACVMRVLSRFSDIAEEDAFLMGLLHDIGDVIVLRQVRDQASITHYTPDLTTFDYLCFKCHQEFGKLIAREWKLPQGLANLISDHHRHPADDDPLGTQRLQLQFTDMIIAQLGYAGAASFNLLKTAAARALDLDRRADFVGSLTELPGEIGEMANWF